MADWKDLTKQARQRLGQVPRWIWLGAAAAVLAGLLLLVLIPGGPTYVPLYEGLSAKQGGQVIDKLQKLGIPYQLNSSGSIIRVPAAEMARARLKLGKMGVPADRGSQAWDKLTQGSMTTSQTAEQALSKRALEETLQRSITGIKGVGQARVTLALPKSTPFLKSQPHPKASVWIHTTSVSVSSTQARAIAQMVANSVPGLDPKRVTVTDQNGDVLAPSANKGLSQAKQQLDFESVVERRAAGHVKALLAPVVGLDNLRVSTAASIDFSRVSQRGVAYGSDPRVGHLEHDTRVQAGRNAPQGPAGSLSNQPPGNAAAPLKTADSNKNKQASKTQSKGQTSNQQSKGGQPRSNSNKWDVHYQVGHTTTVTEKQPWQLRALSVSVVLNKTVAGQHPHWVKRVKDIINHAIAAPRLKINVALVPFGTQQEPERNPGVLNTILGNRALIQAVMELLAALLILLGVARPLARWIKGAIPAPSRASARPGPAFDNKTQPQNPESPFKTERDDTLQRAQYMAQRRPDETAEMIKGWISAGNRETDAEQSEGGALS